MARKRKRQRRHNFAWVKPALIALVLCGFIGAAAVGYVWQKEQNLNVYDRISERESELKQLRDEHRSLIKERDRLLSPSELESRVEELNLGLRMPEVDQILQLEEPDIQDFGPDPTQQYVDRNQPQSAQLREAQEQAKQRTD